MAFIRCSNTFCLPFFSFSFSFKTVNKSDDDKLPILSEAKAVKRKNVAKEPYSERKNECFPQEAMTIIFPGKKKSPSPPNSPRPFTDAKGTHPKVTAYVRNPQTRRCKATKECPSIHQSYKCADDAAPNGVTTDHYVARAVTGSEGMGVKRRPITQHRPPPL